MAISISVMSGTELIAELTVKGSSELLFAERGAVVVVYPEDPHS
jgi:hypothetical protein